MRLFNRTLRAAEALKGEDTAELRRAARLAPLTPPAAPPSTEESDLTHALRTRRLPRTAERH